MTNEKNLPTELIAAAQSWEKQFQQLGLSSRTIPLTEWDSLPPSARRLIPQWLMDLLATHSLAGPLLERSAEAGEFQRYFSFWLPVTYAQRVTPDDPVASAKNGWWLTEEMINDGFIPLCDESDGNLWLTSISGSASSPVYLCDLSAAMREAASDTMASFLASCNVSKNQ
jgi:hypothetical protein